jgi:integrase
LIYSFPGESGGYVVGRRSPGDGSVYQRKDNSWCAQYRVETLTGRKTKYLYAKSEKEAKKRLRGALAEVARHGGGVVPDAGSLKVAGYLDRWYEAHSRTVRYSTARRYEHNIRLHLKPSIGSVKLAKLNALHLEALYAEKLKAGYSPRTVQYVHATIHKALRQAVRWSLIAFNPADSVVSPKAKRTEITTLTREQVRILLDTARGDDLEALYILAVTAGLRIGEILALQWQDVDLENGTLKVQRTISYGGAIEAPKTPDGKRSIKLSQAAVQALRCRRERHESGTWVFASQAGTPYCSQNIHNRHWKPLLRRAGLPSSMRFHTLRHTNATLLLEQNVNPLVVSQNLGHSDVSYTLRTYTHPSDDIRARAARAMDDILGAWPAGATFVEHLGGEAGFWNVMRLYPEQSLGVVMMGNTTRYDHETILDAISHLDWSESTLSRKKDSLYGLQQRWQQR